VNRERLPWVVRLLRAFVYAACAGAFAWPLAQSSTAICAAVLSFAGVFVGTRIAATSVRTAWLAPLGFVTALVVHGLCSLVGASAGLGEAIGDAQFLALSDGAEFGLLAFVFASTVSALSARVRWLAVLEVALAGAIVSQLVADHRHGAINRPFEIADPILASGGDPMLVIYLLGAVSALLLALVLVMERRWWRLLTHLAMLLLLIGTAGVAVTYGFVPRPQPTDSAGLGLRGKPNENQQNGGKGKGGRGSRPRPDNDALEFQDQTQNRDQQTPVAVVLLHDDYSPPTGIYYFRQGAFSQFNGRRLVATTRDGLDRDVADSFPVDKLELRDAPQAGFDRATIETTVALLADHTRPFGLESPVSLSAQPNPNPDRFRRVYNVVSSVLTADLVSLLGHGAGNPKWSAEDRAQYLALPKDPRYLELAKEIVKPIPSDMLQDPMVSAYAITSWLGKNGIYSLRSKHASAEDPTAHFLFGDKTGYCVHFAHAAVYLMRALGVPSRVATGYAVEESARQGGSAILIQSGAAHAWPEVYLEGLGWVVFDVQPEQTLDPPPAAADADLQRLLGQLARGMKPMTPEGLPPPSEWSRWIKAFARKALMGVGYAALAVLFVLYLVKIWRAAAPALSSSSSLARVAYRAEIDRLAEVGITRKRGESREAFAARVRAELPSLSPLTLLHVGAHFGSERAKSATKADIVALRRGLRAERNSRFGLFKRWLGALLPWSWLKAR
jgi:transglutaminase-like putative cysteine protease